MGEGLSGMGQAGLSPPAEARGEGQKQQEHGDGDAAERGVGADATGAADGLLGPAWTAAVVGGAAVFVGRRYAAVGLRGVGWGRRWLFSWRLARIGGGVAFGIGVGVHGLFGRWVGAAVALAAEAGIAARADDVFARIIDAIAVLAVRALVAFDASAGVIFGIDALAVFA